LIKIVILNNNKNTKIISNNILALFLIKNIMNRHKKRTKYHNKFIYCQISYIISAIPSSTNFLFIFSNFSNYLDNLLYFFRNSLILPLKILMKKAMQEFVPVLTN